MIWKRTLLLVPAFVGADLAFIAAHDSLVGSSGAISQIAGTLSDPLALFAKRSPGERGSGALFSTKPERTAAVVPPHERVLSSVRERQPASGVQPGVGSPLSTVTPEGPSSGTSVPDQSSLPGGTVVHVPVRLFPQRSWWYPWLAGGHYPSIAILVQRRRERCRRYFPQ